MIHGIITKAVLIIILMGVAFVSSAQEVLPREINAARNIRGIGTTLDTNTRFTLEMRISGSEALVDTVNLQDSVEITTQINPEQEDIGELADIILVSAHPQTGFTMRNEDGNFVPWNGVVPDLVPFQEQVPLSDGMEVEILSGELGVSGDHRLFVGFLIRGDTLYFTPQALKFTIHEAPQSTAREQALELFETRVSPNIIHSDPGLCIQCHIAGGLADIRGAFHKFVSTTNSDHLSINFEILDQLNQLRGSQFILAKVQGGNAHGGLQRLVVGSDDFNDLAEILDLLTQSQSEQSASTLGNAGLGQLQDLESQNGGYVDPNTY